MASSDKEDICNAGSSTKGEIKVKLIAKFI